MRAIPEEAEFVNSGLVRMLTPLADDFETLGVDSDRIVSADSQGAPDMSARFSPTQLTLLGSGSSLPGEAVGNDALLNALKRHCGVAKAHLAKRYAGRLGITSRHLSRSLEHARSGARDGMDAPSLCRKALQKSGPVNDINYLLGHTSTPHTLLPPNIAWVADDLAYSGPYLELRQACTGFANALVIAAAMIGEDPATRIGIVGSENGSPYFDINSDFALSRATH